MIVVRSSSLGNTLGNILPWCIAGRQALKDGHEAFSMRVKTPTPGANRFLRYLGGGVR